MNEEVKANYLGPLLRTHEPGKPTGATVYTESDLHAKLLEQQHNLTAAFHDGAYIGGLIAAAVREARLKTIDAITKLLRDEAKFIVGKAIYHADSYLDQLADSIDQIMREIITRGAIDAVPENLPESFDPDHIAAQISEAHSD